MARKYLSVAKKLEILKKAETSGNINATARAHNVQPNQIRNWRKNQLKLIAQKQINCKSRTVHSEESAHHPQLEQEVYTWMLQQRKNGFAARK